MPIKIPEDLPARPILEGENIFVMTEGRANRQDIRPLEIAIVNLMPTKIATETQLLRLLGNTPLQVNVTLLRAEGHESKNTIAAPRDVPRNGMLSVISSDILVSFLCSCKYRICRVSDKISHIDSILSLSICKNKNMAIVSRV